jgi:PIN domain nuclease of toxin-antitoxin system
VRLVLDTCALVWATTDAARLSPEARRMVAAPESEFVVSSISIWEIAVKERRGKLELGVPPREYVARLRRAANLQIVDVTAEIWLASVALDWVHRDPADRTIVATAAVDALPIMTRDARILGFYPHTILA